VRDYDFSPKVMRDALKRAGGRCVIPQCRKHLASFDVQYRWSWGHTPRVISHKNSGSPAGPRPAPQGQNPKLLRNALATCPDCARRIDLFPREFSSDELDHYRKDAWELTELWGHETPRREWHLVCAESVDDVARALCAAPNNQRMTRDIRESIASPETEHSRSKIMDLLTRHLEREIDAGRRSQAGLAATLFLLKPGVFEPEGRLIRDLERLCGRLLKSDPPGHSQIIDPLAFALHRFGKSSYAEQFLPRFVSRKVNRETDFGRILGYVGGYDGLISWLWRRNSCERDALERTCDAGRLLELARVPMAESGLSAETIAEIAKPILRGMAEALTSVESSRILDQVPEKVRERL